MPRCHIPCTHLLTFKGFKYSSLNQLVPAE
uniref:Uncharacterized protein n=1 Tax=Anguilla anguilla TaxID=7936 RepID=A0A0E9SUR5_ANGAN